MYITHIDSLFLWFAVVASDTPKALWAIDGAGSSDNPVFARAYNRERRWIRTAKKK